MSAVPPVKRNSAPQPPAFEPLDLRLLAHPLDFLQAEHYRLRAALAQLDGVARGGPGEARRKLARALLRYFGEDYALHVADEEADFFPLLRHRCAANATFLASLDMLIAEHRVDRARLGSVLDGLRDAAERRHQAEASPVFAAEARAYIEAQRRHIARENAVVMPIARRCLSAADLRRLGQKFAIRRGVARGAGARSGSEAEAPESDVGKAEPRRPVRS